MSKPDEQGRGGVSRQEELLYGHYAPFVRRAGQLAVTVEQAEQELMRLREAAAEADQHELGKVSPAPGFDSSGRSPETRWLDDQIEEMNPVYGQIVALHRRVAQECMTRWQAWRHGPDDGQWDDGAQPDPVGTEETAQMLRQLTSYGRERLSAAQIERACQIADSLDPEHAGWRPPLPGTQISNALTPEAVLLALAAAGWSGAEHRAAGVREGWTVAANPRYIDGTQRWLTPQAGGGYLMNVDDDGQPTSIMLYPVIESSGWGVVPPRGWARD